MMNTDRNAKEKIGKGFLVAGILLGAGLLSATTLGAQFFSPRAAAQEGEGNGTTAELGGNTSASQVVDNNNTESATVSTNGIATTKVEPDEVSVTVGVETNGTTAQEASSKNANLTDGVLAALTGLGIPGERISTSNYNVYPVYSQEQQQQPAAPTGEEQPTDDVCTMIYPPPPECQPKQEIIAYVASSSLTVTLDVAGDVDGGQVIDTAIDAGANTVGGAYFSISTERQEEIREGLIGAAIENARHRADVAATAAGMEVSEVQAIQLNDVNFPVFSSDTATSRSEAGGGTAAPTQLQPGEQEVTMTVSVIYYIN
jgi:uncharacterized protein YggE